MGVVDVVGHLNTGHGNEAPVSVGRHGGAALDVKQGVVPSVTDLAGEQAERTNAGVVGKAGRGEAGMRPFKSAQLP